MTTIFSQNILREMICVVRPKHNEEIKDFYTEYGRALAREGFINSGGMLRAKEPGRFGSGVIIEYNENYYVLTNFHVVEHSQFVSLEFQTNSENQTQYDDCRIIISDKNFDLALIEIPSIANIQSGFTFSDIPVKEGSEVWTAGFPGLANKPSWQLGKGIISNESIKDSLITNSKLSYVIQHTAQVDAGSSGGALLIASENEKTGYSIIGINTWKARGRENVNFAIPNKAILSFLEILQNKETSTDSKKQVEKRTKEFITAISKHNYRELIPFVSESYIFEISAPTFIEMFKRASKEAKDDAEKAFRRVEPFEGFRIIIADAIYTKLKNSEPVYIDTKDNMSKISVKGKEIEIEWIEDSENWTITSSTIMKVSDSQNVKTNVWDKIDTALYGSVGFPLDGREDINLLIGREFRYLKYLAFYLEFSLGSKYVEKDYYDSGLTYPITTSLGYVGCNLGVQGQYPMKLGPIHTIPFVKNQIGMNLAEEFFDLDYGIIPGIRFAIQLGKKDKLIYIDTEFRNKINIFRKMDKNYVIPTSASMFGLSLGYAY